MTTLLCIATPLEQTRQTQLLDLSDSTLAGGTRHRFTAEKRREVSAQESALPH